MSVALTDRFVLHVRMRDAFVRGGRIGIDRDHAVVGRMALQQIGPVEANLERAQVDAIQFNGFRRHRQSVVSSIEGDVFKLIVQRDQVSIDVAHRGNAIFPARGAKLVVEFGYLIAKSLDSRTQIVIQPNGGQVPTVVRSLLQFAVQRFTSLPRCHWQRDGFVVCSFCVEPLMDRDRHPHEQPLLSCHGSSLQVATTRGATER